MELFLFCTTRVILVSCAIVIIYNIILLPNKADDLDKWG
jgi:hypothetical protein